MSYEHCLDRSEDKKCLSISNECYVKGEYKCYLSIIQENTMCKHDTNLILISSYVISMKLEHLRCYMKLWIIINIACV